MSDMGGIIQYVRRNPSASSDMGGVVYSKNDPRIILQMHFDTGFEDTSRYNRTATVGGNAAIDTGTYKYGPGACVFDGTGDYVQFSDSTDFTLGTGDFTVQFWTRFNSVAASTQYLAGQSASSGLNTTISFAIIKTSSNKIEGFCCNGSSVIGQCTGTTTVTTGVWYHVAYVRYNTGFAMYVNGISEATAASALALNDATNALSIGRLGEFTSSTTNGWIDDFQFANYAIYTGNFTPAGPVADY